MYLKACNGKYRLSKGLNALTLGFILLLLLKRLFGNLVVLPDGYFADFPVQNYNYL